MAKRVSGDRWLFTVTLCLGFVGLVMVFSASAVIAKERYGSGYTFLFRQLAWAVTGIIAMFVAMKVDYRRYKHPAVVFSVLGVTTLMLISVFFLDCTHHTHRWIHWASFSFQPSEIANPALILFLAFLDPYSDPQGRGFHIIQSLIAVSTGGITGLGLMEGKQKLFYLPEPHTDFIFAVTAEELGLVGALVIIALFAILLWRGMRTSLHTQDMFGRLLSVGITSMVVVQAFINVSVVLGLMPTKGIPLPFVSYGGSSLFMTLACVGVLLNISKQAD